MDNNIKCEHKILRARPSKKRYGEEKKGRPNRATRKRGRVRALNIMKKDKNIHHTMKRKMSDGG